MQAAIMASARNDDLDTSGMSAEDSTANEENFDSGDEHQSHSEGEADEDPAEDMQFEEGTTKSLTNGLANCSITPEKRAARLSSADPDESLSDEEMHAEVRRQAGELVQKAEPGRPKFTEMIIEAMVSAGPSRSGVSVQQIKKLIHLKYPDLANKSDIYFRNGLKRLVETEELMQVTGTGANGSYKLVKKDKTKAAPMSKAPAVSTKTVPKPGPKSSKTAKSTETKKTSSSKSPMKSSGKSIKAAVTKTSVTKIKSATVKLTKMSDGTKSKIATSKALLKSDAVVGTAKPRGRPAKNVEINASKSPSKSKAVVSKSNVPSKASTNVRTGSAKSVTSKSPKPKSVAPKSPKPKSVAPKSPKPKSATPKSPKLQSKVPKSPAPRAAASKAKLDSAPDNAEKTAPGPASKRGKK